VAWAEAISATTHAEAGWRSFSGGQVILAAAGSWYRALVSRREPLDLHRTTAISINKGPAQSQTSGDHLLIVLSGNHVGEVHQLPKDRVTLLGRDDSAEVQLFDAEVSRRHLTIRYDEQGFHAADLGSLNGSSLNGERLEGERRLAVGDKIHLGATTVIRFSSAEESEAKYALRMYHAALRDGLTGAFNRRYFDERLVAELAFARRHEKPLALLLLDLDRFKAINDELGHRAGDAVLVHATRLIEGAVRTEDVVARFGGEELAVLCRDTDTAQAAILAERLRTLIERTPCAHDGLAVSVTVSVGVACLRGPTGTPSDLLERADQALYAAKSGGRNRCCEAR
jgi:diguanylate cyclase (GGDEF)-like protein